MADDDVFRNIDQLVAEEHRLQQAHGAGGLGDAEHKRLREVEVALDQCWDLLRQRRARRDAGQDASDTAVRDADTVEGYRQ